MIKKQFIVINLLLISFSTFANIQPGIQPGIQGHHRGDIIAVQTDSEIAAWCDFTKQIVLAQPNTLCVYIGDKSNH